MGGWEGTAPCRTWGFGTRRPLPSAHTAHAREGRFRTFLLNDDDNTLPPAHFHLLARRGARIPRRASLPTQEGKEQPWS